MKKILKKNQFIVTFLAVLIAVAGYLNYSANLDKKNESKKVTNDTYESIYSKDNLLTNNEDIESMDKEEETTEEPGAAVLTNGSTLSSYMVQAKLNREQTRSKNKETLLEVINNNDIGDKEKRKLLNQWLKLLKTVKWKTILKHCLKQKDLTIL